jgi:CheY-like chemotaxis protein
MRTLVVEDVEANITLAKEMFRIHFGIEIDVAHDGAEAISRIQTAFYHVVFMDIQMPVMDGIEATRRIRAMGYTVPIIAMTASAMSDQVKSAYDIGMNGYITKPVRRSQLQETLLKYCPQPTIITTKNSSIRPSVPPAPISIRPSIADRKTEIGKEYRDAALEYFASLIGESKAAELLRSSIRSVANLVPQLASALEAQDKEATRHALHALKGLLLNSGLVEPAESTARAEQELRSGAPLLSQLTTIQSIIDIMKAFVSEEKP